MANDLNQCNFIGRLGNDPEIRYTPTGDAVANFSIAVGESWKDKGGQKQERTTWVRLVAFRKTAEIIGQYLGKGSRIFVTARLQIREWEKDGIKRQTAEFVVDRLQMLGGKPDGQQGAPQRAGGPNSYAQAQGGGAARDGFEDDGLPF